MASEAGERLDHYLVRLGFARSRRAAREMLELGLVRLNGRPGTKGQLVTADDRVEVTASSALPALVPDPEVKLEIIFRDPSAVVVSKPAPMPCHPLRPGERGTVMNGVVAVFPDVATVGDNPREGGLVHRLDNGTSGALLVACTSDSFSQLREAIRSGRVHRTYQALVSGKLKESLKLEVPLAHDPRNPRKIVAVADRTAARAALRARAAVTSVETIRTVGRFTLAAITPQTGLRHQIRVHLAHAGYPIVGDTLYGGPSVSTLAAGRFWLHLCELEFRSPSSGPVRVRSPLPRDLEDVLKQTRRSLEMRN
jgi:23S rRNA pseudouridine1911/1915/1917 synthase